MPKEAKQTITGKAFEYALLNAFLERLQTITNVSVIDNEPLKTAKKCFDTFNNTDKGLYNLNASFAVNLQIYQLFLLIRLLAQRLKVERETAQNIN